MPSYKQNKPHTLGGVWVLFLFVVAVFSVLASTGIAMTRHRLSSVMPPITPKKSPSAKPGMPRVLRST